MTAIDSYPITHDAFGRIVEFKSSPTYQILYAPTGLDLAVMNGQTIFYGKVPLPGGGRAVFTGSGLNDYTHVDWQGSARFGSTTSRGMLFDMAYAPYGEIYAKTGGGSAEAFTGQYRDIVGDEWDFLYRQEHSSQGRWISPDPAGLAAVNPMNPQTWNRYAYVAGMPLNSIDRLGLACGLLVNIVGDDNQVVGTEGLFCNDGPNVSCAGAPGWVRERHLCDKNHPHIVTVKRPTSIIKRAVKSACATLTADVRTFGVGTDLAYYVGANFQLGWAANGRTGEFSFTDSESVEGPGSSLSAYVYTGDVKNVLSNASLNSSGFALTGGVERVAGSVGFDVNGGRPAVNSAQISFGPSLFAGTAAVAYGQMNVEDTIPFLGYLLNPDRAICKALGF